MLSVNTSEYYIHWQLDGMANQIAKRSQVFSRNQSCNLVYIYPEVYMSYSMLLTPKHPLQSITNTSTIHRKKHYTFYKAPTTSKQLSTAKFYPFRAHRQIPAERLQSSIQPTVKAPISHQMQSIYYQLLQTSQIISTMWKYGSTTHLPSTFL